MIPPLEALQKLKEGNIRFVEDKRLHPNMSAERRIQIKHKQSPFSAVLACADSRTPPLIIFDQGLGDIFSIRVAGNSCCPSVLASLEIGVASCEISLIVVMGHHNCGAVNLVVNKKHISPNVDSFLQRIVPSVEAARIMYPDISREELVVEAAKTNAIRASSEILRGSPLLAQRYKEKNLLILPAFYDIHSGIVKWLKEAE